MASSPASCYLGHTAACPHCRLVTLSRTAVVPESCIAPDCPAGQKRELCLSAGSIKGSLATLQGPTLVLAASPRLMLEQAATARAASGVALEVLHSCHRTRQQGTPAEPCLCIPFPPLPCIFLSVTHIQTLGRHVVAAVGSGDAVVVQHNMFRSVPIRATTLSCVCTGTVSAPAPGTGSRGQQPRCKRPCAR